jgi:hypothetical protein
MPRGRALVALVNGIVARVSLKRPLSPMVSECSTLPSPNGMEVDARGDRT